MGKSRSTHGGHAWAVPIAASALVLAVLEVGLSVLIADTAVQRDELSLGARLSLAAYGLALLMAGVSAVGGFVMLLGRAARPTLHPIGRWTIRGLAALAVWAAVFLYGASWTAFWNAGIFLDRGAIAFWLPHPVQVFHWVYPPLAIGVFAATVAGALTLGLWVPGLAVRLSPLLQRRLVGTAAAVFALSVIGAVLGSAAYDRVTPGQRLSPYAMARDDRTSPLVHALADLRGRLLPAAEWPTLAVNEGIGVLRRPIISMAQYVAGVERTGLKPWNVVSIQIESLRADQLRAYGGSRDVMPTLDALAREGRVFTNAYIQASHSNYADLVPLSSHYPLRSTTEYAYPPNPTYPRVLIYDVLKAIGYKTAIFSSQNENWGGMVNFHRPASLDRFFHAETFAGPTYTPWEDAGFAQWVTQTKGAGSVDDRYTVGEAMKWVDSVKGEPFFLHMNLQSSHVPYVVPADFTYRFSPKTLDFTIMWGKFPLDRIDAVKDRYADSLYYEDTQIARLFDHLRQEGLWERTIIIIGGDNGEAFYEHGFPSHAGQLYNEVMKVPMIVRVPGLEAARDDRPAMFLDIPPTVLDLLGLPSHPSFQGISLFERRVDPDRSVYMIVQTPIAYQSAIVRGDYKLLQSDRDGSRLLFDLARDPGEKRDVSASRPDLVDALTIRLQVWRTEQLNYYQDVPRQAREYPPVLQD